MDTVIYTVICIAIIVVVFLLCRELVCWYWKINEHLAGQEKLTAEIAGLRSDFRQVSGIATPTPTPAEEQATAASIKMKQPVHDKPQVEVEVVNKCPNCGAPYRLSDYREDAEIVCSKCKEPLTQA